MLSHRISPDAAWCLAIVALFFAGCSGNTQHRPATDAAAGSTSAGAAAASTSAGAGANSTSGGAGASSTNGGGGDGDQPAPGPNELERLLACDVEEPCPRSSAQLIEASIRNFSKDAAACVLEGLRDRKPGRYLHDTDGTTSGSSDGTQHVVLITDAGEALLATKSHSYGPLANADPVVAGQRCQLKPASYFDGCLSALAGTDADAAWLCLFGSSGFRPGSVPWFESCSGEVGLSCE